jgi:4-hydroxybenzoate polyprenyltransferase
MHKPKPQQVGEEMAASKLSQKWAIYAQLLRWHKPIGTFLLLWPTLISLWIASAGWPQPQVLVIFVLGTFIMRSVGCAINDLVDRDIDSHVLRTRDRPLASGRMHTREAWSIIVPLFILAIALVWQLNPMAQQLAGLGAFLTGSYPFFKRFFPLPQAYLGLAWGFGGLIAFAATSNRLPPVAWVLLCANIFWVMAYDTAYAMVDSEDDKKIGLRSSALTLGRFAPCGIWLSYSVFLLLMAYVGYDLKFSWPYWLGWLIASIYVIAHAISTPDRERYFRIFMQNNYLGATLFLGVLAHYGRSGLLS